MIAIIPARYDSVRLPGKMLLDIAGKPLILHTLGQAKKAKTVGRVIVATDDQRIYDVVTRNGGEAVMTAFDHASGSDRVAEVAAGLPEGSIIANVQGDEPLISPDTIDAAVQALRDDPDADMATVCEPITDLWGELLNGNVVKAVVGDNGYALYFSRSPMPWPREASLRHGGDPNRAITEEPELLTEHYRKHTGLYVYRREFLLEYTKWPQTELEKWEMLEQIRALEHGARIRVVDVADRSIGVDTENDLERVRDIMDIGVDFRCGRLSDVPAVARVHVESWRRSFAGIAPKDFLDKMSVDKRVEALAERFNQCPYSMLVAEHREQGIVGFGDFGAPRLEVDHDAQIYSFYLLPEFQRNGLGTRLFKRCVSRLAKDGVRSLCLDSLEVSPYRAFYEKMGGRIVGRDRHDLDGEYFETVIYGWDDISQI